jgi:hypothetical protein
VTRVYLFQFKTRADALYRSDSRRILRASLDSYSREDSWRNSPDREDQAQGVWQQLATVCSFALLTQLTFRSVQLPGFAKKLYAYHIVFVQHARTALAISGVNDLQAIGKVDQKKTGNLSPSTA